MSPRSLLFSSDQETSQLVGQVLRELGLEVEACVEIFAAIEKLTTRNYEIVVADLADGAEAAFLLKTCAELSSARSALSVAIASLQSSVLPPGIGVVLTKPLIPEKIKWALTHAGEITEKVKAARAEVVPIIPAAKKVPALPPKIVPIRQAQPPVLPMPPQLVLPAYTQPDDFSEPMLEPETGLVPLAASASAKFKGTAHQVSLTANPKDLGFLDEDNPLHVRGGRKNLDGNFRRIYRPAILTGFMLWLAYIGIEPARSAALVSSVAVIYTKAVENTETWLQAPKTEQAEEQAAEGETPVPERGMRSSQQLAETIRLEPHIMTPEEISTGAPTEQSDPVSGEPTAIPNSLRAALKPITQEEYPAIEAKLAPTSVINGMQPVVLPEELSKSMLVDKVEPDYPQQALASGLQGPVVLQAWIGKDGKISDLKLVHGYMVLGKAASDAVRKWRFRPYILNGQAVDSQTVITVDFKLPNS
jgi:TonB family protein